MSNETKIEKPINKRKRPIRVVFLNGEVKEYESCSEAVRSLGLKNRNCFSGYWIKGKCVKSMHDNGIESVEYIDNSEEVPNK